MKPAYERLNIFPRRGMTPTDEQLEQEIPLPTVRVDNPMSYGGDFNLIRAVQEYGPQRITKINKELDDMQERANKLIAERGQLEKIVAAVAP